MTTLYNTYPAKINLFAVQGDGIDMEFYVNYESLTSAGKKFYIELNTSPSSGVPFFMTSARLQVRRKDGLLIKDWISGVSPADIVLDLISGGYCHLTDVNGFEESGFFDYDLEVDNGMGYITIMTGVWKVKKQITI